MTSASGDPPDSDVPPAPPPPAPPRPSGPPPTAGATLAMPPLTAQELGEPAPSVVDDAELASALPSAGADDFPETEVTRQTELGRTPYPPKTLPDTGLDEAFLVDLALKHIYFGGEIEAIEVAQRLGLEFLIVRDLLDRLKKHELVMVPGGSGMLGGMRIRYRASERGRQKAAEILARDNYRGPAPVPFEQYVAQLGRQGLRAERVTPAQVEAAFADLVVEPDVLQRIGPAINSGRSIFLYGPPGNGKTSMADCIIAAIGGDVFVPQAIIVDSEIVRVYDTLYHRRRALDEPYDARWVPTQRPVVVVGGELSLEALDLTVSGQATYYEAPFQVKANSGVLFIDDFGRQRCDPQELLNRWIVPLESGFDFLTFRSGQKVRVPFDSLVVFSTNLDPKALVDEAFLRRIRYKIAVGDPSEEAYKRIFRAVCARHRVVYDEAVLEHLLATHYREAGRPLRCCQPRDLIEQLVDGAKFTGETPTLTVETIDRVCSSYFARL